jgi:pimeloyl-ACP methyl ester carboxylesterase
MLETIFQYHLQQLTQPLLAGIVQHKDEMAAVSPHEKLSRLRVPVFLLHGADDDVIPPAETLWLARDIPPAELRRVLVSSALHHVDTNLGANWPADLKLVSFMAAVIRALEHEPPAAVQSRKAASISEDLQSSR